MAKEFTGLRVLDQTVQKHLGALDNRLPVTPGVVTVKFKVQSPLRRRNIHSAGFEVQARICLRQCHQQPAPYAGERAREAKSGGLQA